MKTFDRYKQNLKQYENKIYSYDTHVATLHYGANMKKDKDALIQHGVGATSPTTSRHINYVARELNLEIV
jgi:hypothetical protein